MRTALLVGLLASLGACKHQSEPAAKPAMDWARCEQRIHSLAEVEGDAARAAALMDACPVCGDFGPLLAWNTPASQGGPRREAIEANMKACDAWCVPNAQQFFMGTLDEARGVPSRAPWRHLAEQCKDKVSAVPDARYASAPYFALDRIGRAVAAHGGPAADELASFYIGLPPVSVTGAGIDVPEVAFAGDSIADNEAIVTVMGEQLFVASRPKAHLTGKGVVIATVGPAYPGEIKDAAAIARLPSPTIAVVAPREMLVSKLQSLLAPAKSDQTHFVLAVAAPAKLPGWNELVTVQVDFDAAYAEKATVQDLAATAKPSLKLQVKP